MLASLDVEGILNGIEKELQRLRQARHLLQAESGEASVAGEPGSQPAAKRRVFSPEARKRIAEAQKKRWAALKAAK